MHRWASDTRCLRNKKELAMQVLRLCRKMGGIVDPMGPAHVFGLIHPLQNSPEASQDTQSFLMRSTSIKSVTLTCPLGGFTRNIGGRHFDKAQVRPYHYSRGPVPSMHILNSLCCYKEDGCTCNRSVAEVSALKNTQME